MDYEKKYKEALERAKEKYTKCYSPALLEYIFPELKKNKDIEIRRSIIRNLKRYIKCIKDGYDTHSAKTFVVNEIEKQIAWLEKQGQELKKVSIWKHWKNGIAGNGDGKLIYLIKMGNTYKLTSCLGVECDYIELSELDNLMFEKQGEQKPANSYCQENCKGFQETGKCFADEDCKAKREAESTNKVKPKFKVGDWIVFDNGNVEHITSVGTHGYTFDDGDYLLHDECDKIAHLWSIQDAKDGDVLVCKGTIKNSNGIKYERICLFNNFDNAFFTLTKTSNCVEEYDINVNIDYPNNTSPATKEQKEILFMVMKESGYEWDAEKKKLKKIGNEIEIPFGAKDSELQEATYHIPKGFHAEIDDDKVIIKKGEKSTAWSDEDERIRKRLINLVNEIYDNTNYITFLEHKELLAWLEKLDNNIIL